MKSIRSALLALAIGAIALLRYHWPARRWLYHALGWFWWGSTPPTKRACVFCGVEVTHDVERRLWWVFYNGHPHAAPCGAPCAGGIPTGDALGDEFRAGADRCPRCVPFA